GIRVPMIVRWPGRVKPGTISGAPGVSMDFYPTFLEVTGLSPINNKPIDGESLVSLFQQTGKPSRGELFFHFPNYAWHMDNRLGGAVRSGDYKLIRNYDDGSVELYNLKLDIGETRNLAMHRPRLAKQLNQKLSAWLKGTDAWMPKSSKPGKK
ncbi:MAG TPA: DUF4976 domain-containing protein, partial [Verrucomicrobiota bacterium]|nr:DUF4976 domain-containing protein [Verrucomicrobiota bacterium]